MIPPFIDPPPAIVNGYAARALATWLRAAWGRGDFASLPADGREQVYATVKAIEYAGEAWARRRVAAVGNSATLVAAIGAQSSDDMSIAEAATVLEVKPRRMRQLAAEGLGHKVGASWVCDRDAVLAEAERRSAA